VDVTRADTVDASEAFDRLVSQRASQDTRPDPAEQEELWKASVRAHNTRREEENRAAWCEHHQEQAARLRAVLEGLIARHEAAAKLLENQRKGLT
jgi:hypothetical protein